MLNQILQVFYRIMKCQTLCHLGGSNRTIDKCSQRLIKYSEQEYKLLKKHPFLY